MKKAVFIPLIAVGSLILTAGIFFGVGLVVTNHNIKQTMNVTEINDDVRNINVDVSVSDLEFKVANDGKSKIITEESNKFYHEVKVENNTLKITQNDTRNGLERFFNFNLNYMKVYVYLPMGNYGDLQINSSTGDTLIPEGYTFSNVTSRVSTGSTKISSHVINKLDLKASTGNIEVEKAKPLSINIETSTGNIKVKDSFPLSMDVKASTGHVDLENVIAGTSLKVETSTGDITLRSCDSLSIEAKAFTGNVNMSLLSGKIFDIYTTTGKRNVPTSSTGLGVCKVSTSTGDINISVL